jgi:hypothetical protein
MSIPLTQRIIIVWRYAAGAVAIILFCGLSALLGIVAAIAYSPATPPFTLPPLGLLFVSGVAGIVIVFALTLGNGLSRFRQRDLSVAAWLSGMQTFKRHFSTISGGQSMWLEDHFGSSSVLQRNERVKLAASFWNNIGVGMVIAGIAAAFFLDKPQGTWTKVGIAIAGLVLGWLCYSIASNMLTYMHTAAEERH